MAAQLVAILGIVMPVFIVVAIGYGLRLSSLVDNRFLLQLNALIYYLALPLLLFYKIASADFSASFNPLQVVGLACIVVAGFVCSYLFAVLRGYSPEVRGTFCQCAFRGNLAYVGLAIVFNAYGEKGLATAGILLGCVVPILNFCSIIALLLPQHSGRFSLRLLSQQIVFNPLIIACLLGILWSVWAVPIPLVADRALHIITGMALPLALLSIGASFSLQKLRGDLVVAFLATAFKLVVMPGAAALLLALLGVRGEDLAIAVLFAGTPTATAAYIFTQQMKGDAELAGAIIMLTTLLSVVSFTLVFLLLNWVGI